MEAPPSVVRRPRLVEQRAPASDQSRPPCGGAALRRTATTAGRAASASERSVETTPAEAPPSVVRRPRLVEQRAPASDQSRPPCGGAALRLMRRPRLVEQRAISRDHPGGGAALRRTASGLDYPFAPLTARPPCGDGRASVVRRPRLVEQRAPASDQTRPPCGGAALRRTAVSGLDSPFAALTARPPCGDGRASVVPRPRLVEQRAPASDQSRPPWWRRRPPSYGEWSRLSVRSAHCSTTLW